MIGLCHCSIIQVSEPPPVELATNLMAHTCTVHVVLVLSNKDLIPGFVVVWNSPFPSSKSPHFQRGVKIMQNHRWDKVSSILKFVRLKISFTSRTLHLCCSLMLKQRLHIVLLLLLLLILIIVIFFFFVLFFYPRHFMNLLLIMTVQMTSNAH